MAVNHHEPAVPSHAEVLEAFLEGYRFIDDGRAFMEGFNICLERFGYQLHPEAECTCSDHGRRGHLPECRWFRTYS
jgi:hypothetical protein